VIPMDPQFSKRPGGARSRPAPLVGEGNRLWLSRSLSAGLLRLSRLRERPTRSQSAAGEGSHNTGTSSATLDNPDAERSPTPALPRKREREPTADAAASCKPYARALRR